MNGGAYAGRRPVYVQSSDGFCHQSGRLSCRSPANRRNLARLEWTEACSEDGLVLGPWFLVLGPSKVPGRCSSDETLDHSKRPPGCVEPESWRHGTPCRGAREAAAAGAL